MSFGAAPVSSPMDRILSADGTPIAYRRQGEGRLWCWSAGR